MKRSQAIIFYILSLILIIGLIVLTNNPANFITSQEIVNLKLIRTSSSTQDFDYQIYFEINNGTELSKELLYIHLELCNSSNNNSELIEIKSVIIPANDKIPFRINHKSNNNYNCVNVYTSIDGVRVLQASYEIPNTDSENNIVFILDIVSIILFCVLVVINIFRLNSNNKVYNLITNILFVFLTVLIFISCIIKKTDTVTAILSLLPLYSFQFITKIKDDKKV